MTVDRDESQAPHPPRRRGRLARAYAWLLCRLGWLPTEDADLGGPDGATAGEATPAREQDGRTNID